MLLVFALAVWAGISAAATLLMCALGHAGRMEDEARGYAVPRPRASAENAAAAPAPVNV